jgi:hypothetical protein
LAKSTIVRIIISAVLTIVLLGFSRKMSTRNPQEIKSEFDSITANHTTLTESRFGVMPKVTVRLSGDQAAQVGGVLFYQLENGAEQSTVLNHTDELKSTGWGNRPETNVSNRIVAKRHTESLDGPG